MSNSWENVDTSSNKSELWFLTEPQTKIRIFGTPRIFYTHVEPTLSGAKKRVICPGVESGCPLCQAGKVPNKRYALKIIDQVSGQPKVLEVGVKIIRQIKFFAKSFPPEKCNFLVTKLGVGIDTNYVVAPLPEENSPITDEESNAVAELDVDTCVKAATPEEIKSMGFLALPIGIDVGNSGEFTADDWASL